jgi:hypothetical protein
MNSGKVKCTCGWSWNKSDSSKKDMHVCHECGRDNSNNMKNGGWLDSYADGGSMQEHQENYNDNSVSLPEGYVGEGYNTKGRDYSPAWGGQFEDGGLIPMAQKGKKVKPIYVESKNDPRYQAYQDSLNLSDFSKFQHKTEPVTKGYLSSKKRDVYAKTNNHKILKAKAEEIIKNNKNIEYINPDISVDIRHKLNSPTYEGFFGNGFDDKFEPISTWKGIGQNFNYAEPKQKVIVGKKPQQQVMVKSTTTKPSTKSKPSTKPQQKEVNVKPQLQPRVEAINLPPMQNQDPSFPKQELDLIRPIQAPKSYNVNTQRYNMQGPSDYYQANEEGVDYETALKAKQAADAYNKSIEKKYGNPEALKNPKAAERLKQLRQDVQLTPQYQMGGSVYPVNYVPQAQNGKLTFLQPTSDKLPEGYRIPYADPSSELAMSIGGEDGEPSYLIPSFKYGKPLYSPIEEFKKTGEHLGGPFKTWQEADEWERTVRHPYVEQGKDIPLPIKTWGEMAMGGSIPGAVGFSYARTNNPAPSNGPYAKKTMASAKSGKVIKDDRGQWAHPGEITEIGSPYITMEGVPYDVLGISDTGDTKLMKPGKNYKFKGKKVTEFPMAKNGIRQEQKGLVNLDQLTNFTNYNTKQPGGWMDKYQ